jgi:hypothetical protein
VYQRLTKKRKGVGQVEEESERGHGEMGELRMGKVNSSGRMKRKMTFNSNNQELSLPSNIHHSFEMIKPNKSI